MRDVLALSGPVSETVPMYDLLFLEPSPSPPLLGSLFAFTHLIHRYDYLMRHDRSMCMTMETVMPFGNDAWFRYALGWALPPKMWLLKASHTPETREASVRKQVYQDVAFPAPKLSEAVDVAERLFGIWPLLCYPCTVRDVAGRMVRSGAGADRPFFNLGIYGVPAPLKAGRAFQTVHRVRVLAVLLFSRPSCVR